MRGKTRGLLAMVLGVALALVAVLGVAPREALADTAYAGYLVTNADTDQTLPDKVVHFNGVEWYVIEDNSSALNAGTLTLLAANNVATGQAFKADKSSNKYSQSDVIGVLKAMTETGDFKDVAGAIVTIESLTTNEYNGNGVHDTAQNVKLYLLSTAEANAVPENVRRAGFHWWLRSPGNSGGKAAVVFGSDGIVNDSGRDVSIELGVRPALKLNLESVIFESQSRTFSLPVSVTGVTLDPSTAILTAGGDPVALTATVEPADATDKTVKWLIKPEGEKVTLYSDADCKTLLELRTATDKLTVYAKGLAAGNAVVEASSNEKSSIFAECDVTVSAPKHAVAGRVVPEGAGVVGLDAPQVAEGATAGIEATPADGYEFEKWTVDGAGASVDDEASPRATLTMGTADVTVTANFKKKDAPTPTPTPEPTPTPTPEPTPAPAATVAKASKPTAVAYVSKGEVAVSWKAAKGAKSYQLQWRKAGAKKWSTASVKGKSKTVAGLKAGACYEFRVRGVNGKAKGKWSSASLRWLKGAAKAKAATGKAKGAVKATWKADKAATGGFKVFVYAKKGGKAVKTKVVKAGSTSATVKGLKSGKTYYVRVRPYRVQGGSTYYGAISGYRSVKAK